MKDLPIKKMKELDIELKKSIYNRQIPELLFTPAAVPLLVFELAIPVLLSSESNEFLGCKISNIKFVDKQRKNKMVGYYYQYCSSIEHQPHKIFIVDLSLIRSVE
jgi:hypothetical protein